MNIEKDKILFEALQRVLQDKQFAIIADAFQENQEALQRMYSSLAREQQSIIADYAYSLADVYTAALTILLEEASQKG